MSLPVLNLSLLNNLIVWAWSDYTDHRDGPSIGHWNQGSWFRTTDPQQGTGQSSYCMAGQAVAQVGYKMVLRPNEYDYSVPADPETGDYPIIEWNAYECVAQVFDGLDSQGKPTFKQIGEPVSISDTARRALGLTPGESEALFSGANSHRILLLSAIIAAARGETLTLPADAQEALDNELAEANGSYNDFRPDYFVAGYSSQDERTVLDTLFPPPPTCDSCGQVLPKVLVSAGAPWDDLSDEPPF